MTYKILILSNAITVIISLSLSVIGSKYLYKPQQFETIDMKGAAEILSAHLYERHKENWEMESASAIKRLKEVLSQKVQTGRVILLPKGSVIGGVRDITRTTVESILNETAPK
jgi:hypothetical protein